MQEDAGVWTATVVGSEFYSVQIDDTGDEVDAFCDCPYEFGPYCKHVAAVLYAIQDQLKRGRPEVRQRAEQKQNVRSLLDSLSREQLLEIVLDQLKKDKALASSITLQYSAETLDKAAYARIIEERMRAARGREGYIDYSAARQAAASVNELLNKAGSLLESGQRARALPILQAVIETMPSVVAEADDSDGGLSGSIEQAFEMLREAMPAMTPAERGALFDYCLEQAPQKSYRDLGTDQGFIDLAADLVETQEQRQTLFAALDRLFMGRASFSGNYHQEFALEVKRDVMVKMGDSAKAIHDFLLQHVHLNWPRMQLIQTYMEQGQYAAARKLCSEGLELYQHQGWRGLVHHYRALLLEIARRDHDPQTVVEMAQELLISTGRIEHLKTLRENVPAAEWPALVRRLITTIEKEVGSWLTPSLLGEIYVQEKLWDDLLRLAQRQGVAALQQYHEHLSKRFPDEASAIYEKAAHDRMRSASGRDAYREVCHYLRRMVELGQDERVAEIVETLKAHYPRRRAMIEELDNI